MDPTDCRRCRSLQTARSLSSRSDTRSTSSGSQSSARRCGGVWGRDSASRRRRTEGKYQHSMLTAGADHRSHTSCIKGPQEAVAELFSQSCMATWRSRWISVMVSTGISSTGSRSTLRFVADGVCAPVMMFMPSRSTNLMLPLCSPKSYEAGKSSGVGSEGLVSSTKFTVRDLGDRCSTGL